LILLSLDDIGEKSIQSVGNNKEKLGKKKGKNERTEDGGKKTKTPTRKVNKWGK
jgi:hypothetical protein